MSRYATHASPSSNERPDERGLLAAAMATVVAAATEIQADREHEHEAQRESATGLDISLNVHGVLHGNRETLALRPSNSNALVVGLRKQYVEASRLPSSWRMNEIGVIVTAAVLS